MVFNCSLVGEETTADVTLHVDLYNGIVRMYNGERRQKYKCVDLVNVIRGSECTIQVDNRKSLGSGPKVFRFAGRELAYQFQQYVEYIQDCGDVLRQAYNQIDRGGSGAISTAALAWALSSQDIDVTDGVIDRMLQLSAQNRFDFSDFFHVLLGTPVYSLHSCLTEWIQKAYQVTEIVVPPEDSSDLQPSIIAPAVSCDSTMAEERGGEVPLCEERPGRDKLQDVISFSDDEVPLPPSPPSPLSSSSRERQAVPKTASAPGEREVSVESLSCLPGESAANIIPRVKWYTGAACFGPSGLRGNQDIPPSHPFMFGTMVVSNYRIALVSSRSRKAPTMSSKHYVPPFFDLVTIPLNTVYKLLLIASSTSQQKCSIRVHTKDLRVVRVHFTKPGHGQQYVEMLLHMLQRLCFSGVRAHLFAYRCCEPSCCVVYNW